MTLRGRLISLNIGISRLFSDGKEFNYLIRMTVIYLKHKQAAMKMHSLTVICLSQSRVWQSLFIGHNIAETGRFQTWPSRWQLFTPCVTIVPLVWPSSLSPRLEPASTRAIRHNTLRVSTRLLLRSAASSSRQKVGVRWRLCWPSTPAMAKARKHARVKSKYRNASLTPPPIIGSSCTWTKAELDRFRVHVTYGVDVKEMIPSKFFQFKHLEKYEKRISASWDV